MPGESLKDDFVATMAFFAGSYRSMAPSLPLNNTAPSRATAKLRLKPTELSGAWKIGFFVRRSRHQRALPSPASRLHHQTLRSRSRKDVAVQRFGGRLANTSVLPVF